MKKVCHHPDNLHIHFSPNTKNVSRDNKMSSDDIDEIGMIYELIACELRIDLRFFIMA